jgi:hypothetical protein
LSNFGGAVQNHKGWCKYTFDGTVKTKKKMEEVISAINAGKIVELPVKKKKTVKKEY